MPYPTARSGIRSDDFRHPGRGAGHRGGTGCLGVACSAGSACQSGSITPSHVLSAIGVAPELANAAIRMSLGMLTTDACIDRVAELFPTLVEKARRLTPA